MVVTMTAEAEIKTLIDKINRKIESNPEIKEEVKSIVKTLNIDLDSEKYSFRFADAKIDDFRTELLDEADITLTTTAENFTDLMNGDLSPMKAYITGKVKLKGKFQDLMFLKKFL